MKYWKGQIVYSGEEPLYFSYAGAPYFALQSGGDRLFTITESNCSTGIPENIVNKITYTTSLFKTTNSDVEVEFILEDGPEMKDNTTFFPIVFNDDFARPEVSEQRVASMKKFLAIGMEEPLDVDNIIIISGDTMALRYVS